MKINDIKTPLTDAEIIKTLNEADGLNHISINCMDNTGEHITPIKVTDIVDLINRLEAEREALIAGQETLQADILYLRRELAAATNCRILERATKRKLIFNETCTLNILHQECTGEPLDCNCCTMECDLKKKFAEKTKKAQA